MKNRILKPIGLAAIVSVLALMGCKKYENMNLAKTGWNPNLAIPIGHANFGVYDILAAIDSNDLIVIDPNSGEIALVYSSEIASFDSGSIVDFGSVTETVSYNVGDMGVPASGSFSNTSNTFRKEIINVNMANGVELDSVYFKAGVLDVHLESDLKHDLTVKLTFPQMLENGVPLTATASKKYTGTLPQTEDIQFDLTDVHTDFTRNGVTVNETEVEVTLTIAGTGEEVSGTEDLSMSLQISNAEYHHAMGYFAQQSVGSAIDSVLLRVFQNASQGTFKLRDPAIKFQIDNSFGFPIQIDLANLKTINVSTGVETILTNYPTQIDVAYPSQLGQSSTTIFELNSTNTDNIASIISPTPKYFHYEVDAKANPADDQSINNFIEDDSRFVLRAEVDMPLDGLAYGFNIKDTLDFIFNEESDLIESVTFRVVVDNGFPVILETQMTAIDANGNKLFDLFVDAENLVESAQVDVNGVVNQNTLKINDIPLSRAQIEKLAQVKKIIIFAEASTPGAQNGDMVKFFDYYNVKVNLAMQIQGSASF